ncbi:helix-turn-helix domain-containing protein [Mucilaginibacter sp. JRF]|uniref:helix-turn-helix domain-containing protein n=1 Tax=Mucilaginibacter sp. JRF TaxID=2780088 RepID=UPI00188231FD|nr:AraC family transcriptional regulator [Mucilaginibacter sp. JRF]MBE9586780.1 helix-turn-helix domain-containing protein [Mucilaginibacter sp. JRF]
MKKTQFEHLVIHDLEEEKFHLPVHSHTYYEIVYIWKGKGVHLINSSRLPYKAGDLFIISPEDEHYFDIKATTRFTFIKFTDAYFSGHKMHVPDAFNEYTPESVMRNRLLKEVKLQMDEPCISILRNTVENIISYNCRKDVASSSIVYYQILSLLGLIKEAAAKLNIRIDHGQPDKEALISYIHQHIYQPDKVQIKHISTSFSIAPSYFSDYFKRNFGMSYRNYINDYRVILIEKRLEVPTLPVKQITKEFGFTDESHLSHFFKKLRKMTPAEHRKQFLSITTSDSIKVPNLV